MDLNIEHIDELIEKFLLKTTSEEEEVQLLDWVKASKTNEQYFIDQQKVFNVVQPKIDFDTELALKETMLKAGISQSKSRKLYYAIASIAAAVALVFGVWLTMDTSTRVPSSVSFATMQSPDSISEQTLADGSIVTLDTNANLKIYDFSDTARNLELTGKAFFKVAKNPNAPFTIIVDDFVEVTVLGTQFEINHTAHDSCVVVSVIEGKVSVTDLIQNKKYILEKNQKVSIWKHVISVKENFEGQNFLVWKTGFLDFKNTPVRKAIKEIGLYYNKRIVLGSKSLEKELLNATFDNESFDDVKQILSMVLSVEVVEHDGKVIINPLP